MSQYRGGLRRIVAAVVLLMGLSVAAPTQEAKRGGPAEPANLQLKFNSAPMDLVLQEYADKTGRTLLLAPSLPTANITLRSQGMLTQSEFLEAIETVLGMNGIALLLEGDKFVRVVPNKQAREEPMPITTMPDDAKKRPDRAAVVSQMIPLKHIESAEAMKAVQPLLHSYAQTHAFEGINSLLLTDTAANVNRVMEVIALIDQPIEAREEPIIVQIHYAKASDIKAKLEQILAETVGEKKSTVPRTKDSGAPGVDTAAPAAPVTPPGLIRARREDRGATQDIIEAAERGLVVGEVKIIEDDRTNILILITRPENMTFFEKIIRVLDVPTDPDVMVRVIRLEFAESKDIASMLNELIGAAAHEEDAPPTTDIPATDPDYPQVGQALRDYVAQRQETMAKAADAAKATANAAAAEAAGPSDGQSKVGELSKDNIKILSDERTNSLIVMASKNDMDALEEIIRDMDMMLSQVLVEAVILGVDLDDSMQTGVDWVQRALVSYNEGPNGELQPKVAYAGGGGGGNTAPIDPTTLTTPQSFDGLTGAGLSYYLTLFDLNMDMVFKAVASDSRTRILSSPVILTTDNKAATIEVTQDSYFFKGQRPVSTGVNVEYVEDVERQKVGIKLMVTPRINAQKFVVMEIEQTVENVSGSQRIGDTDWPVVASRKLDAEVAVRSGETIVLGGLVQNEESKRVTGVPFLADIPILGIPFRSTNKGKKRQEVVVFITPYVMDTPQEVEKDTARRQDSLHMEGMWQRGWSDSRFAEPRQLGEIKDIGSSREKLGYGSSGKTIARSKEPVEFVPHNDSLLGDQPGENADGQPAAPVESVISPSPTEPAKPAQPSAPDPMSSLDPELREYIDQQDKRFEPALERVDERAR